MNTATLGPLSGAAFFLLTWAFVCCGAAFLQKRIEPDACSADSFLESVLIATAWVVFSSTVIGCLGLISLLNMLLADAAFFMTSVYLFLTRVPQPPKTDKPAAYETLNFQPLRMTIFLALAVAAAAWVWAWVSPPPPWDAFVYHLSFPASWIKSGKIFLVTVPFGDQAGTYFPSNAELIYMRILLSLGQDFATNALQLIFLASACVAVYKLSRTCGAGKAESSAAACAAFFMPILFHQAVASEVDIIFSAFFVCSLYFLFRWAERPESRASLFFAFLALGLFAGTKSIALVFMLFIAAPTFVYFLISKREWSAFLWGPGVCVIFGGFWHIRNLIVTGNPVFPLTISAFGKVILHGAYTRWTMLQSLFHTNSGLEWLGVLREDWGTPLLALCCACTILAILWPRRDFRAKCLAAFPWLVAAICFFAIPYNREVRFTFSAFLIACASIAWVGSRLSRKNSMLFLSLLPVIFIVNIVATSNYPDGAFYIQLQKHILNLIKQSNPVYRAMAPGALLMGIAAIGAATAFFMSFARGRLISGGRPILITCGVIAAAGVFAIAGRYPSYQYAYYSSFPMGRSWSALRQLRPEPARVAYTGTDLNFGLTGPRLKNSVYYVPVTRWHETAFHECAARLMKSNQYSVPDTDRIDFCRRDPDYVTWIERLIDSHTDLLYVTVLHQNDLPHLAHDPEGFPIERQWADAHTDQFRLIYSNPQVRIYDVGNQTETPANIGK
ncbi:MAG: hypothetical protein WCX65_06135 [bacterium]